MFKTMPRGYALPNSQCPRAFLENGAAVLCFRVSQMLGFRNPRVKFAPRGARAKVAWVRAPLSVTPGPDLPPLSNLSDAHRIDMDV